MRAERAEEGSRVEEGRERAENRESAELLVLVGERAVREREQREGERPAPRPPADPPLGIGSPGVDTAGTVLVVHVLLSTTGSSSTVPVGSQDSNTGTAVPVLYRGRILHRLKLIHPSPLLIVSILPTS